MLFQSKVWLIWTDFIYRLNIEMTYLLFDAYFICLLVISHNLRQVGIVWNLVTNRFNGLIKYPKINLYIVRNHQHWQLSGKVSYKIWIYDLKLPCHISNLRNKMTLSGIAQSILFLFISIENIGNHLDVSNLRTPWKGIESKWKITWKWKVLS